MASPTASLSVMELLRPPSEIDRERFQGLFVLQSAFTSPAKSNFGMAMAREAAIKGKREVSYRDTSGNTFVFDAQGRATRGVMIDLEAPLLTYGRQTGKTRLQHLALKKLLVDLGVPMEVVDDELDDNQL